MRSLTISENDFGGLNITAFGEPPLAIHEVQGFIEFARTWARMRAVSFITDCTVKQPGKEVPSGDNPQGA